MSNKTIRLFVVGEGDEELQLLIEKGLSEIGVGVDKTPVAMGGAAILDQLGEEVLPIVIKPAFDA